MASGVGVLDFIVYIPPSIPPFFATCILSLLKEP